MQALQQQHGLQLMVGIECELYLLQAQQQEGGLLQYHAPHTPRTPLTGKHCMLFWRSSSYQRLTAGPMQAWACSSMPQVSRL